MLLVSPKRGFRFEYYDLNSNLACYKTTLWVFMNVPQCIRLMVYSLVIKWTFERSGSGFNLIFLKLIVKPTRYRNCKKIQ